MHRDGLVERVEGVARDVGVALVGFIDLVPDYMTLRTRLATVFAGRAPNVAFGSGTDQQHRRPESPKLGGIPDLLWVRSEGLSVAEGVL